MVTPNFLDLLDARFKNIWQEQYDRYPKRYETLLNVLKSDRAYEKHSAVTGFGAIPVKDELADITYDVRYQGYDKTYTHLTYARGFKIADEMIEDDLFNVMAQSPKAMGTAVGQTIETLAASIFNNGFDVTNYPGPNAMALLDTSHPSEDGSARTFDNIATAAALTHSTLAACRLRMRKMDDPRGFPILLDAKYVVVPPDLEETAKIIVMTDRKSGSANWDYNLLNNSGLEVIVWPHLSSTTAYFMMCPKGQHKINWYWRKRPEFERDKDFDAGAAKWKTRMRLSYGWDNFRGIDGNAGA